MTTEVKLAAIEAKLAALEAKLSSIEEKLVNMPTLFALNLQSQHDKLLTAIKEHVAAHEATRKTKKEVPATTDETKEGKVAEAPAATHPTFSNIAKTAWEKKTKATTEHEKIMPFLVAMRRLYGAELTKVVGEDVIKEVENIDEFKTFAAKGHKPAEVATKFVTCMWGMLAANGRLEEISKKVVAFHQKEYAVLNGQKIDSVKSEAGTDAEAQAAAALAAAKK